MPVTTRCSPCCSSTLATCSGFPSGWSCSNSAPRYVDAGADQTTVARCAFPRNIEAGLPLGRLRVFTTFPLGLFVAWSNVELDLQCLVYPTPGVGPRAAPRSAPRAHAEGPQTGQGQDDFAGLRKYQPGDSLRHVAWKAVARGQPLMTKQFSGLAAGELWLEWEQLARRLRHRGTAVPPHALGAGSLARAGHAMDCACRRSSSRPATGPAHQEQCLTALALFKT